MICVFGFNMSCQFGVADNLSAHDIKYIPGYWPVDALQ